MRSAVLTLGRALARVAAESVKLVAGDRDLRKPRVVAEMVTIPVMLLGSTGIKEMGRHHHTWQECKGLVLQVWGA